MIPFGFRSANLDKLVPGANLDKFSFFSEVRSPGWHKVCTRQICTKCSFSVKWPFVCAEEAR